MERESHRNAEVIWLTGKLMPDFPDQDLWQDHHQLSKVINPENVGLTLEEWIALWNEEVAEDPVVE